MRIFSTILLCLVITSSAAATIVTADADGFTDDTDISSIFSGITLSAVGGYTGLDPTVYAFSDGLASTPTSVFANNLSFQRQWYADLVEGFALRADFDLPANYVAIDIIGDDSGDSGILDAYNSADELIYSVISSQLTVGQVFTAEINSAGFDIAYIIAGGTSENTVHLDNLTATVVPEPTTLSIFILGGLILTKARKNTK